MYTFDVILTPNPYTLWLIWIAVLCKSSDFTCNDHVSTLPHGRRTHLRARTHRIDKSYGVRTFFFFQLRHFRSELPSFLNFSSSMVSCIVGSWLLSRNREFRFSRIGEIRRIDGNLISRERTTALKDFAYIYMCV